VTYAVAPAWRAQKRDRRSSEAVRRTTGTPAVAGSARRSRQSCKPEIPGIQRSVTTASGGWTSAISAASAALATSSTTWPWSRSRTPRRARALALSSTKRIRATAF
jgi:hypothetical protein